MCDTNHGSASGSVCTARKSVGKSIMIVLMPVHYNISIMDDAVIERANIADFKDFEDAMQYFSAIATNCDLIVTRNQKNFKNTLIPVMNAESYLQTLK